MSGAVLVFVPISTKLNPRHCMDKRSPITHAFPMPTLLRDNCWICRGPLGTESTRVDEFGFIVHEQCLRNLNERKDSVGKTPDTPKGLR